MFKDPISNMKKYLMNGMVAIAFGGMLAGCSNDLDGTTQTAEFNIVQNYENAFIGRFGEPAPTQDWGFSDGVLAGTRAVVAAPSVTEGDYTYNALMALSWEGVSEAIASGTNQTYFDFMSNYLAWQNSGWADKYWDVHGTVVASNLSDDYIKAATEAILNEIPENTNNLSKAKSTGYSIVTTGGPVTLTPIYHYSNSGDRLSYYYYPVGQKPSDAEIKKMKKYSLGEMSDPSHQGYDHFYKNTYSLVYEDANGNCSYDFPANYVINFVISNTWGGQANEIYQEGGITSTADGGSPAVTLESKGKFAIQAGKSYSLGEDDHVPNLVQVKFGKNSYTAPAFKSPRADSHLDGYSAYTEGNGVEGSLAAGGTCYYIKPWNNQHIRLAVVLNAGKKFYIKDLGVDGWSATDGTALSGYDGITKSEKYYGTFDFYAEKDHVYAIYAENSKLGFYGYEVSSDGVNYYDRKALQANETIAYGQEDWTYAQLRFGRIPTFAPAGSNTSIDGYSAYTGGTGINGGLSGGATTYYFRPWGNGYIRVAVKLNANKSFYVKDLGDAWDAWDATDGTVLSGFNGMQKDAQYIGTIDIPVEANHVYAVYAEGTKLGFYGCEFMTAAGESASSSSSTVTDIVKKSISCKPDYYSDGNLNAEIHSTGFGYGTDMASNTSHTAVFQSGDYTFVGFEDWVDFDFNDVIFAITGTVPEKGEEIEIDPDPDPNPDPNPDPEPDPEPGNPTSAICRIVVEDLTVGENSDFDFNDVVFDVCPNDNGTSTTLIIRAIGGELPLYIGQKDAAHEVHAICGVSQTTFVNTGWKEDVINYQKECGRIVINGYYNTRAKAKDIDVIVTKGGTDIKLSADVGKVASKICVGTDFNWCAERQDIDQKFHKADGTKLFQQYVIGNFTNDEWYKLAGK